MSKEYIKLCVETIEAFKSWDKKIIDRNTYNIISKLDVIVEIQNCYNLEKKCDWNIMTFTDGSNISLYVID